MIVHGKRFKGLQVHREKETGDYMYVHTDLCYIDGNDTHYDCYATFQAGQRLPRTLSGCTRSYLEDKCTNHIPFKKLPEDVQKHLTWYCDME